MIEMSDDEFNQVTLELTSEESDLDAVMEPQALPSGAVVHLAPEALRIITDDVPAGADTVTEARKLAKDLTNLLALGGFPLRIRMYTRGGSPGVATSPRTYTPNSAYEEYILLR